MNTNKLKQLIIITIKEEIIKERNGGPESMLLGFIRDEIKKYVEFKKEFTTLYISEKTREEVKEIVGTEDFIDEVVARVNRKQIRKG